MDYAHKNAHINPFKERQKISSPKYFIPTGKSTKSTGMPL